jgi:nucleoside-diphosphate-sugar epimerase
MIVELVGRGSIELRGKDADFPSRGALNIDRARAVLGFDPKVDVIEGFENYYGWFKNSVFWSQKTI